MIRFAAGLLLVLSRTAFAQTPPGELLDVGGYRVHIDCTGAGRPAVMILGGFSFDWALVQPEVAKFTRVCTWDASGTAFSDASPEASPTCRGRVDEIDRLLRPTSLEPPGILAGFSVGVVFARLLAKKNPAEAPLVARKIEGLDSLPVLNSAAPITFDQEDESGFDRLPPDVRALHRWASAHSPARTTAELAESSIAELDNSTLGRLPLAVVSTSNDARGYAELQHRLLQPSSNSIHFIAARSFRSIEISEPEVVVDAIQRVVAAARATGANQ